MSKQQKKFQTDISSPHEILPFLSYPGITVLELYARWCGPTPAVEQTFRQYYLQFSGSPLRFVRAPSDILPFARRYHGRCRPVFLIIQGGVIQRAFCGINLPELDSFFQSEPAKLPQAVEELKAAKPFLPQAQLPELAVDEQFAETWELALQERAEALEKLEIARQNGLEEEIDPDNSFDIIIEEYAEKWQKLENYDDVNAACEIVIPSEGDYAALQDQLNEAEKLDEFIGDLKSLETSIEEIERPPEQILALLLPKFQDFYEKAPDAIDVGQVFDECVRLEVDFENRDIIEEMAELADSEETGRVSKFECCLIASTVHYRPRLAQIRDGSAVFVGGEAQPEAEAVIESAQGEEPQPQPLEEQQPLGTEIGAGAAVDLGAAIKAELGQKEASNRSSQNEEKSAERPEPVEARESEGEAKSGSPRESQGAQGVQEVQKDEETQETRETQITEQKSLNDMIKDSLAVNQPEQPAEEPTGQTVEQAAEEKALEQPEEEQRVSEPREEEEKDEEEKAEDAGENEQERQETKQEEDEEDENDEEEERRSSDKSEESPGQTPEAEQPRTPEEAPEPEEETKDEEEREEEPEDAPGVPQTLEEPIADEAETGLKNALEGALNDSDKQNDVIGGLRGALGAELGIKEDPE